MMTSMNLNILGKGINLSAVGINEYVYALKDIDMILFEIKKLKLVILGGDVYIENSNGVTLTYDNWYYTPINTQSDCILSIDRTKKYIQSYIKKHDTNYYFSFILDNV